ncbi:baseplate assembly protein [Desulfovibrio gilichinskyi]|uniref:Phage-related baseplate assembly protein n=1 Tax=Desulfovibrio gilichinskyi TaxID=1519643 RepID=A0A1X7CH89_9BACT|nr:baseplate J/gp47 family protein [Desulfovibrio gilichinskyi]SME96401.1 Phage-related baseplate assembly protein [Desulfovibrio gilichinskyi]
MNGFTSIDMSKVPAPDVVETLDYEAILADILADLRARDAEYSALVESDPAYKILEVAAYRELNLRQRVNDATRAVMVAYALGNDLDNLAALAPVERKIIDAGDSEARPVIPPTYESDEEFRKRTQMAPEGFSVAGPDGAYVFHALKVPAVRDASALSSVPGEVEVYVLGRVGDGTPNAETLIAVNDVINGREVRPLTDHVTVKPAEIVNFEVNAKLFIQPGPAPSSVIDSARSAVTKYVSERHTLGSTVPLSGIYAALHVEGVAKVELASPVTDLAMQLNQAAFCTAFVVEEG